MSKHIVIKKVICFFLQFKKKITVKKCLPYSKSFIQKYGIYHSSRVFIILEWLNHSRTRMHEWYAWFILWFTPWSPNGLHSSYYEGHLGNHTFFFYLWCGGDANTSRGCWCDGKCRPTNDLLRFPQRLQGNLHVSKRRYVKRRGARKGSDT